MNLLPQSERAFVSRMGPRCYGGLVNALGLTVVLVEGCPFALQTYALNPDVTRYVAGRSERVLTANEQRVCVALLGIMSATKPQFDGPERTRYLVHEDAGVKPVIRVSDNMSVECISRGSQCGCSPRHQGSQVRLLPIAQKAAVAQRQSIGIDRPRVTSSATTNEGNGSEYAGYLRKVGPLSRDSRGPCRRAILIRSADRPESSGGPIATGYLPYQGSSRSRGAFPAATTRPSDCFRQASPGGPKSIGYHRFESRRAGEARSSQDAIRKSGFRGQSIRHSQLAHLAASPRTRGEST